MSRYDASQQRMTHHETSSLRSCELVLVVESLSGRCVGRLPATSETGKEGHRALWWLAQPAPYRSLQSLQVGALVAGAWSATRLT